MIRYKDSIYGMEKINAGNNNLLSKEIKMYKKILSIMLLLLLFQWGFADMKIEYIDNTKNKTINLPMKKINPSGLGKTQPQILLNMLNKMDVNSLEHKVLHDLIYYLSRGNYLRINSSKDIKKPTLLNVEMFPENISGKTNTMGATLFLILHFTMF